MKIKQTFPDCKQMTDVILDRFIMHAAVVGCFLGGCSGWPKAADGFVKGTQSEYIKLSTKSFLVNT
jgi:hypothetical protein